MIIITPKILLQYLVNDVSVTLSIIGYDTNILSNYVIYVSQPCYTCKCNLFRYAHYAMKIFTHHIKISCQIYYQLYYTRCLG